MILLIALFIVVVLVATYLSTMNLALRDLSRAALQRKLDELGARSDGDWLHDQVESTILATALLRTLSRMAIYILVLAVVIDLRTDAVLVDWGDLIISGLIAAAVIWLTTIVISTAIERYCGILLIARSLTLLHAITIVFRPLTKSGSLLHALVRRLAGPRGRAEAEAELLENIEDTHREGGLDIISAEILENVVEFTSTEVSEVMTPRPEIEGIEYTDDLAAIRAFIIEAMHSRIPVYCGSLDNIVGILYVKDLVRYLGEDAPDFQLKPLLRRPVVVPETKRVKQLLGDFQKGKVHLALVVDEYGATAGLVTIEDVLEEIVGDIRDEHEPIEEGAPAIRTVSPTYAEVDGRYRIDELNQTLDLRLPEDGDFATLAGFVLSNFGRMPAVGEHFEAYNARFTALAVTPTQLQRVGVEILPRATGNGEPDAQAGAK